jgi:heme a synthase
VHKALKFVSVASTIMMLLVLLGGALVTKTQSGAGCGDSWPLCHGEIIPSTITVELVIELSHRLVSGVAGILVLLLSILSWKQIGHIKEVKPLASLSFFFLLLQALIGAAAVKWGQSDAVLALHFGISLISFASVFLLMIITFEIDKKWDTKSLHINKSMRLQILAISTYCYAVVYSGAFVRHKDASLACPSWPMCTSNYAFPTQTHEWIQMGHRFAAGIIFIWILTTAINVLRKETNKVLKGTWALAAILVSLQVLTGALIIFTQLNLFVALLHAFFISCLFGILSYLILMTVRSKRIERETKKKVA